MDSLDKAIANVEKIYGHPVKRRATRLVGAETVDPETFLQQPLNIENGWLRDVPVDQWLPQLNTVYGIDFTKVINRYLEGDIAPAIAIDGYPGHGQLMALLLHSQGRPLVVQRFESIFHPEAERDPRSDKLRDILQMSNKHARSLERRRLNRHLRHEVKKNLKKQPPDYLGDEDLSDQYLPSQMDYSYRNLNVGGLVRWSKAPEKEFIDLRKPFRKASDKNKIRFLDDRHLTPYSLRRFYDNKRTPPAPWKTAEQLTKWLEEAYILDATSFNKMLKQIRFAIGECEAPKDDGRASPCWTKNLSSDYEHDLKACKKTNCIAYLKQEKERLKLAVNAHQISVSEYFRQLTNSLAKNRPCLRRKEIWDHKAKVCRNIRKYISRLDQIPEVVKLFLPRKQYYYSDDEKILTNFLLDLGILDAETLFKSQITEQWSDESL